MDQGSTMKRSAVHNFAPTVTKFCVMWEGHALPHDTKFGNSKCEIVGRRVIFIWSLIHGLRWSGLIKAEPGCVWTVLTLGIIDVASSYTPGVHNNSHKPSVTALNSNLVKSSLFTTPITVKESCNFAQRTTVILSHFMQRFGIIRRLRQ